MAKSNAKKSSSPSKAKTKGPAAARAKNASFQLKELDLQEAQRKFSRSRGKGSKYDSVLEAAEKLEKGRALLIEGTSYSEVTGLRNRITSLLGEGWSVSATKADKEKNLFDMLIHRAE